MARPISGPCAAASEVAMSAGPPADLHHPCGAILLRPTQHGVDQLLAVVGRLPHLCHVMPDVVGVETPEDVAGPAADQLGSMYHHVGDVTAAPVMAHEVDRFAPVPQLALEPVAVSKVRRREVIGQRCTETRR